MTAPREPSRAITPVRKAAPPAVEAPPPHLTLPSEELSHATPTRRRRTRTTGVAKLETTVMQALPAPVEEKPKRTRKKAADAVATDGDVAGPKKKTSGVKKTSTRKKASTSTSTRKKKTS
jgi:hypothetical protein